MQCNKCGDTGIIETGNNDLPCDCPKGKLAEFNVAGLDVVLGAFVSINIVPATEGICVGGKMNENCFHKYGARKCSCGAHFVGSTRYLSQPKTE
jgi:hypothetical protein